MFDFKTGDPGFESCSGHQLFSWLSQVQTSAKLLNSQLVAYWNGVSVNPVQYHDLSHFPCKGTNLPIYKVAFNYSKFSLSFTL